VRTRRDQLYPVGEIETPGGKVRQGLFGILRSLSGKELFQRRNETSCSGSGDTRLKRGKICGNGSAAGAAERSDAFGVDIFALGQVIDAATAIVDEVARDMVADQQRRKARMLVFPKPLNLRVGDFRIPVLHALALSDRVDGEDENARAREVRGPIVF